MSEPREHHWLPQFLMYRWSGSDGLVNRFYRPHKDIVAGRKSPKSLGVIRDLYTSKWLLAADPYEIEKNTFTKAVDTPASTIIRKLVEEGVHSLSDTERRAFAQFLTLTLLRVNERFPEEDGPFSNADNFLSRVRTDLPSHSVNDEDIKDHFRKTIDGYEKHMKIQAMMEHAVYSSHTASILGLKWKIVKFDGEKEELVFGDHPIRLWGSSGLINRLFMPLSPWHLFIAAEREYFDNEPLLREEFRLVLALQTNQMQFEDARDFVISRDLGPNNGFRTMAEWYMRMPDGSSPSDKK